MIMCSNKSSGKLLEQISLVKMQYKKLYKNQLPFYITTIVGKWNFKYTQPLKHKIIIDKLSKIYRSPVLWKLHNIPERN